MPRIPTSRRKIALNTQSASHLRRRDRVRHAASFVQRTERSRFGFSRTIATNSITRDISNSPIAPNLVDDFAAVDIPLDNLGLSRLIIVSRRVETRAVRRIGDGPDVAQVAGKFAGLVTLHN